jgi:membrane-associated protease RseP (regulator of RpoE activity)
MNWVGGVAIFVSILATYLIIVALLSRMHILKKHGISLAGPMMMIRTHRGLNFLDKLASPKRFWKLVGTLGTIACFIIMVLLLFSVFRAIPAYSTIPEEYAPTPQMIFVIPGVNPLLPLSHIPYIFIALIIGAGVHEFFHGILLRAQNLKVKSLGLLLFVIPLGAFTEEDEEELKKTSRAKRLRVFSVGPISNFLLALIFLGLITGMTGSIQPVEEGVLVTGVVGDFPGIETGVIITHVNGEKITGIEDLNRTLRQIPEGEKATLEVYQKDTGYNKISIMSPSIGITTNIEEEEKGSYLLLFEPGLYLELLTKPLDNLGFLIALPLSRFFGQVSFPSEMQDAWETPFADKFFWAIWNFLYWSFWLNLMIGLTNTLPISGLDGGLMLFDVIDSFFARFRLEDKKRESLVSAISLTITFMLLISVIVFPILLPRI